MKRKQVKIACVHCKQAHACCEFERPCKRCIQLGLESTCVDSIPKKRGRKRKHFKPTKDVKKNSNSSKKRKTSEKKEKPIEKTNTPCDEEIDSKNVETIAENTTGAVEEKSSTSTPIASCTTTTTNSIYDDFNLNVFENLDNLLDSQELPAFSNPTNVPSPDIQDVFTYTPQENFKEMDSKIEEVFPTTSTTYNQNALVQNPPSNSCRSIYAQQTMNTIITKVAQDEPLFSPLDLLNLDYTTSPKSPCNKTNGWTQKNGQESNYFWMPQSLSMNYEKRDVPSFDSCTYPNQIYHPSQINMDMDISQNKWMSEVYSELCHLKKILHLQNQQIRDMEQEKNRMAIQLLEQQLSPLKSFHSNLFAFVYERTGVGMCCTLTKDLFRTNTRKEARIMSFNKAFQEILGYDQDFLMSASFRDLVHDIQEFKQTLRKYESEIKKGQKFVCSAKFRHVTGKVIEITSLTDIVLDNSHAFGLHIITKVTPAAV